MACGGVMNMMAKNLNNTAAASFAGGRTAPGGREGVATALLGGINWNGAPKADGNRALDITV